MISIYDFIKYLQCNIYINCIHLDVIQYKKVQGKKIHYCKMMLYSKCKVSDDRCHAFSDNLVILIRYQIL